MHRLPMMEPSVPSAVVYKAIWHLRKLNKVNVASLKNLCVSPHMRSRGGQPWLMMVTRPQGAERSPWIVPEARTAQLT